jgi:type I restriction enzyme S subunit
MLSVKDMEDNSFSYADCKYISNEDYLDLIKSDCKPLLNDVLIAKDGSYLKHVFVIRKEIEQAVLSSIGILRPNLKKIVPEYLKYYLQTKSVKETVAKKYVSGSALPRIILKNFGEIDVIYKDIKTQQKIASVLSALDSKIELNNRINAELEAMAKTLYDYWFVQFDFPDKNGKPYKTSGGKMVWNEELKREVPEGWEVKDLGEIINIFDSKRIPLSRGEREKKVGNIPYYGATSVMGYVDEYIFDDEYVLVAEDGSVMDEDGFPIVQFIWGKTWVNNHAHVIQAKNVINNEYIFYLVKTISVIQIMSGSIQLKINQENLKSVKVCVPSEITLKKFASFAIPVRKQLINAIEENQKLTELRDWLLPMLMNGQVRVSEL